MQLPNEIGIMTLPNAILFPQSLLPLYIFEPKYQKMLRESLTTTRMFCVDLKNKNGTNPPVKIAGIGIVRVCVDNEDSTSHLILQGVSRVRILEVIQEKPFRKALIEPLPSVNSEGIEVEALMVKVAEMAIARASQIPQMPSQIPRFLADLKDPDVLSDIVGFTLVNNVGQKQHLLETTDVRQRLRDLIPMLS